jgi:hypothetical protein
MRADEIIASKAQEIKQTREIRYMLIVKSDRQSRTYLGGKGFFIYKTTVRPRVPEPILCTSLSVTRLADRLAV